ncbi:hypothetical protein DPMN_036031, partial [Dreissena polymorpha]
MIPTADLVFQDSDIDSLFGDVTAEDIHEAFGRESTIDISSFLDETDATECKDSV